MFAFDSGQAPRKYAGPYYDDWHGDDGLAIHYRDAKLADRHARQAVARLRACTEIDALREEWKRSGMICDGLWMGGFIVAAEDVAHAYEGRLDALCPDLREEVGSAPDSGKPESQAPKGNGMWENFDAGGVAGPFLVWSAKGTEDRKVGPESFYIREGQDKTDVTEAMKKGFVMDIHALKTGWQESGGVKGVAPKWKWGASPSQLPEKPGDDWKKGFSAPVAIGKAQKAFWEQAGAGAWGALTKLVPQIQAGPCTDTGKVPLIRFADVEDVRFNVGGTKVPGLEIVKWIDRPAILASGAATGFDTGEPEPKREPAPEPAAAVADDDFGDFE